MTRGRVEWDYARSGVSVDRGNQFVQSISPLVRRTRIPGTVGSIGHFSGFFDPFKIRGVKRPFLLAASTDGVGTKLELAQRLGVHRTIGIDLVAMSVNDLAVTGARPLFFLDYLACGKLRLKVARDIVSGIARGCEEAGCALIGGETAEMPGFYPDGRYDLAGFAVGILPRDRWITGRGIRAGDLAVGLASSGFHSNGFSLLRKILTKKELEGPIARRLLTPTRIYVKPIERLLRQLEIKGMAHITGGAFYDKCPRMLPSSVSLRIAKFSWPVPELFLEVQRRGRIRDREMYSCFNMGVGLVFIIAKRDLARAEKILKTFSFSSWVIGEIVRREGKMTVVTID